MSFTLFWFHLIMIILISPRLGCSSIAHDGFWIVKFLFICALYIGVFFIPHRVFIVWAHICRAGSLIFFTIQAYFILNMAYSLNDKAVGQAQSGTKSEKTWQLVLLLITCILVASGCGVWLGF